MESAITIQSLFKKSKDITSKNLNAFILFTLILSSYYNIQSLLIKEFEASTATLAVSIVGSIIIDSFIFYAVIKLSILDGKPSSLQKLIPNINQFIKYTLMSVIYMAMIFLGLLLLIIPGFYLGIKYFFSAYALVSKDRGVAESFKESSNLTKGKMLQLLPILLFIISPVLIQFLNTNQYTALVVNTLYSGLAVFMAILGGVLYKTLSK